MESIATLLFWCVGQVVKLQPFHGCEMGSTPIRIIYQIFQERMIQMKGMIGIYRINPALIGGIIAISVELIITMILPL